MQLVDGSMSHPVGPPPGGFAPAPTPDVKLLVPPPKTTWTNKVPDAPLIPSPATVVGSDVIGRVIEVRDLQREPYVDTMRSPTGAFLQNVLGYAPVIEALSHDTFTHTDASEGIRTNMLLAAADLCFQAHIPFGLRPEVLWYTILSQVAAEVKARPDTYRSMFTTKAEGKDLICVRHDGLRLGHAYGWDQAIGMFEKPLREKVPGDLANVCLPDDLSTCGSAEGLANLIAFMDAASPYYNYEVWTRCGIPKVAILGSAQDWRNLEARVSRIAVRFPALAQYFRAVAPLLTQIVQAADGGSVDTKFWDSMYKRNSGSGGDKLTGWLTSFFAFLSNNEGKTHPRTDFKWDHGDWGGISPAAFPSSVSAVPFIWDYFGRRMEMKFCGGVLTNVEIEGFMTPRLGWAVVHAK
jgi:hypothetical protein